MQSRPHSRNPGQQAAQAAARHQDEPLSDRAVVTLLGGIYVGGLTAFVTAAYALSTLF
jgi:hypothetical protein